MQLKEGLSRSVNNKDHVSVIAVMLGVEQQMSLLHST
jgi:hypothetical protein